MDRTDDLWIGYLTGGLGRYDGKELTFLDWANFNGIRALMEDRSGHLWVGSAKGASRFDGQRVVHFTAAEGLTDERVLALQEDRAGHLWIGAENGLFHYDGDVFTPFTTADGLCGNAVWALLEDRAGRLWIGTWDGTGLCRYDGQDFTHFSYEEGLTYPITQDILEDREGNLWFGTWGHGVFRYDGQVFQKFTERHGLANDAVKGLLQDQEGAMWIATEGGVTRYRPRTSTPHVRIEAVIADRAYDAIETLRIPHTQHHISVGFQGNSFLTPWNQLTYRYRLAGYEDWHQTWQRQVAYADLPVGTYTFEVQAVDQDLNYSVPAQVQLEVYHQSSMAPVRLEGLQVGDVFASFYASYAQRGLGSVQVVNDDLQPAEATLRFYLPPFMGRPFEQRLTLAPQSSQAVELLPHLDADLLQVRDSRTLQAEVELEFERDGQIHSIKEQPEITLHGTGALRWDSVARAAVFITSNDPAVLKFARTTLVEFETDIKALGQPGQNLLQAMLLFEALKQHGVRYRTDANTPYTQASADAAVVDYIQYPAETLQHKAGDCDDLTVLYCSLLENAGVGTALVDYPGHIFLLFDTGVARQQGFLLPWAATQYVMWQERLWIPVEITHLDGSFHQAWQVGLEKLSNLSELELRDRLVTTATAWQQYPSTVPRFESPVEVPTSTALKAAFEAQYVALKATIDEYIDETYLDPLKSKPDDDALRTRLLKVYLALHQVDAAIHRASTYLLEERGDNAATYNHLGNAYALKGNMIEAALNYKRARALRPEDTGIKRNLEQALKALGRVDLAAREPVVEDTSTGRSKASLRPLDVDSFYWIEE